MDLSVWLTYWLIDIFIVTFVISTSCVYARRPHRLIHRHSGVLFLFNKKIMKMNNFKFGFRMIYAEGVCLASSMSFKRKGKLTFKAANNNKTDRKLGERDEHFANKQPKKFDIEKKRKAKKKKKRKRIMTIATYVNFSSSSLSLFSLWVHLITGKQITLQCEYECIQSAERMWGVRERERRKNL